MGFSDLPDGYVIIKEGVVKPDDIIKLRSFYGFASELFLDGHYVKNVAFPVFRSKFNPEIIKGLLEECKSIFTLGSDDEPCQIDREGVCQTHLSSNSNGCINTQMIKMIAKIDEFLSRNQ